MSISDWELLLRVGVAVVLCAAIGLEREIRDQAAGLRTHILVGVGSALFTLVSAYAFSDFFGTASNGVPRVDPTRIAAQIVSGIGFLGAGAILRQGLSVRGLTTAASLWIVAAIGMAAGAGYYFGAAATTVVALTALIVFRRLRGQILTRLRQEFVLMDLELTESRELAHIFGILAAKGIRVQGMSSEIDDNGGTDKAQLELRLPPTFDLTPVIHEISELDPVERVHVRGRSWADTLRRD